MKDKVIHLHLRSWRYVLILLLFSAAALMLPDVLAVQGAAKLLMQAGLFLLSALIGLFLLRRQSSPYRFSRISLKQLRALYYLIPLVLVELLQLMQPDKIHRGPAELSALAIFAFAVGLNEEVYFRGLIQGVFQKKGARYAVIWSSVIFGITHMSNLFAGAAPLYTVLQVVYAFAFGLICALVAAHSGSLVIPIAWHALHDFIAKMSGNALSAPVYVLLGAECAIMLIYIVLLIKKLESPRAIRL